MNANDSTSLFVFILELRHLIRLSMSIVFSLPTEKDVVTSQKAYCQQL